LESVFAAIAAWIILDQVLGVNKILGCFFILIGVIISQVLPTKKN
jgi:drug/metabolite transporter (DMT)-like permease